MKKILLAILLACSLMMAGNAQERKALSLDETVQAAYDQKVIDREQKTEICELIDKLEADRAVLRNDKKNGRISEDEYSSKSKSLSGEFNITLKEILGTVETYKKWQKIRFGK